MSKRKLEITYADPRTLKRNPWNPNKVDPINQEKIKNSLRQEEFFKPIIVRELADGSLEIIGGEHRNDAAIDLELPEVPILNLGPISDAEAKRKMLLDNGRYGTDDFDRMNALLSDDDIGSAADLLSILPIDDSDLAAYFDHDVADLDMSDLDSLSDEALEDAIELRSPTAVKSHQILRFKVTVEDAVAITDLIGQIKRSQGYTESDELTNAGDALIWLVQQMRNTV